MQQHQPQVPPDHDTDFFAWTRYQAGLLRSLGKGVQLPKGLDLAHVAEEIEDLGTAELNAVKSFIRQILIHLIKAASQPNAHAVKHWRSETTAFSVQLRDHYFPSMRQKLDMQTLWEGALEIAEAQLEEHDGALADGMPTASPFELGELVSGALDFEDAVKRLRKGR